MSKANDKRSDVMKKGERWLVNTRGSENLVIDLLEDVDPSKDQFFKAKIVEGRRTFIRKDTELPGDETTIRTTLTTFKEAVSNA